MKLRTFMFLLATFTFVAVVIFFMGDQNFWYQSQERQIQHVKSAERNVQTDDIDPLEKYMVKLGFYDDNFYPNHKWKFLATPTFVTAFSSETTDLVPGFLKSFKTHLPNHSLVIYMLDVDENSEEVVQITTTCNSSKCAVVKFDFSFYPSHVRDLKLSAFRPIIIQELIVEAGVVFWLDCEYVITSDYVRNVTDAAEKAGILSWSIEQPTSALTHPRMFDFFHTVQENYYFHRMVDPSHILLFNTLPVSSSLMKPWVHCALVQDCIAPIGAQSTGCRFDKKPLFRYSGCHRYDESALNVALGLMFNFSASQYVAAESDRFFEYQEIVMLRKDPGKELVTYDIPNPMGPLPDY